jgi:hypothetical protein
VVTDSTGAVVPGAKITFSHNATGASTTKETDTAGEFQFDFLRVGVYTVSIQAQGFKRFETSGITLTASQRIRQTFALEVGAITETVQVMGQTPLVNTVAPDQRESLDRRQLQELPMSRRSFQNILTLGTGIDTSDNGGVRLNGLGRSGLKITVDGTDATSNPENPGTSMYQSFNYIEVPGFSGLEVASVPSTVILTPLRPRPFRRTPPLSEVSTPVPSPRMFWKLRRDSGSSSSWRRSRLSR